MWIKLIFVWQVCTRPRFETEAKGNSKMASCWWKHNLLVRPAFLSPWSILNLCDCHFVAGPGRCPPPKGFGICVELCSDDSSCPRYQKCCSNGCGHVCTRSYWHCSPLYFVYKRPSVSGVSRMNSLIGSLAKTCKTVCLFCSLWLRNYNSVNAEPDVIQNFWTQRNKQLLFNLEVNLNRSTGCLAQLA